MPFAEVFMDEVNLTDIVSLLEKNGFPTSEACKKVKQAFISRRLKGRPLFSVPYANAEIDLENGCVKFSRPIKQEFTPRFDISEVCAIFALDNLYSITKKPEYVPEESSGVKEMKNSASENEKAERLEKWFARKYDKENGFWPNREVMQQQATEILFNNEKPPIGLRAHIAKLRNPEKGQPGRPKKKLAKK